MGRPLIGGEQEELLASRQWLLVQEMTPEEEASMSESLLCCGAPMRRI